MPTQRGNILFLILLAVVLFAALSYAVTSAMRGGGSDKGERPGTLADAIINDSVLLATTVQRLRVVKGCEDIQISFESPGNNTGYANPNAPGDFRCHVFHPNGGGLTYLKPPNKATSTGNEDYLYTGRNLIYKAVQPYMTCASGATTCTDLHLRVTNLSKEVCEELNKRNGVRSPDGLMPVDSDGSYSTAKFVGNYARVEDADCYGRTINGHCTWEGDGFCHEFVAGGGSYRYYHVLWARYP